MRVWTGVVIAGVLVAASIPSAAQPEPSDAPPEASPVDAAVPTAGAGTVDAVAPAAPQPVVVVVPAEPPPAPQASGTLGAYVDDSLFSARNGGAVLRIALGLTARHVAAGGRETYRFRLGASAYAATDGYARDGIGFEAAVDLLLASQLRLGLRASAETANSDTFIVSIGPRLILADTVWFGMEIGWLTNGDANPTGMLLGAGLIL